MSNYLVEDKGLNRNRKIIKTSVIGIVTNAFLATFKVIVGIASHSLAIILDAVNNLSDAASSIITIIGTKLANKKPDKEHPYGHGRVEYLSAMLIGVLVLYAGITSFTEAVKKILNPETPSYTTPTLIIIVVAILTKIFLGRYFKKVGEEVNSESLQNSGQDALMDSVITLSTLVAAGLFLWKGWNLEAYFSIVISVFIIKSGYEMLQETISELLGKRVDAKLALDIKETVNSFDEVLGTYDLILHNYGPDTYNGSCHIEVKDTLSVEELDNLSRHITAEVYQKHHIILTAIGIYSRNTLDANAKSAREKIENILKDYPDVLQLHGFNFNSEHREIRFDVVVGFEADSREKVVEDIYHRVCNLYPNYNVQITLDSDFSEI